MLVHWPEVPVKSDLHIVENGLGKVALWSNIIHDLKKKDPEKRISIQSPWPDLYDKHKDIYSSIHTMDQSVDYKKYFDKMIYHEPYKSHYLKKDIHMTKAWRDMYDLPDGDTCIDLHVSEPDALYCNQIISNMQEKPYVLLQLKGGTNVGQKAYSLDHQGFIKARNYEMDYELVTELYNNYNKDYFFLIIRTKNDPYSPSLENYPELGFLENEKISVLHAIAQNCKTFISIDSCVQHFCSQRGNIKKGVVMWGAPTDPITIGHDWNVNLMSEHPSKVSVGVNTVMEAFESIIKPNKKIDESTKQ